MHPSDKIKFRQRTQQKRQGCWTSHGWGELAPPLEEDCLSSWCGAGVHLSIAVRLLILKVAAAHGAGAEKFAAAAASFSNCNCRSCVSRACTSHAEIN
ncbi:hypothetical protein NC652_004530 [Populus alba x Populus x berolinensis]|nr:hypothetical protein NC652_004530 [Populus alba x Populus x berolinensis]